MITDDYDYDFENLSNICGVNDFAFDNVLSILFCISEEDPWRSSKRG